VPLSLKIFLTALAIADDIGAVLVIAIFYTEQIHFGFLIAAGVFMVLIVAANRAGLRRPGTYILLVLGVWVAVFASGVHATVAGILVALLVPVKPHIDPKRFLERMKAGLASLAERDLTTERLFEDREALDTLEDLHVVADRARPPGLVFEHYLHPVQAFLILPLFALFNAGVVIDSAVLADFPDRITLGILFGLIVGKQIGVMLFSWLAIKSGRAAMPEGVTWPQIWGVSCLAGVGFTMSLFVSELAFTSDTMVSEAKLGIILASLIAGTWGFVVLSKALPKPMDR
jgi:NhaA family Na+:H+ antiporter